MGIPLASNFDIGSPIPIDSRMVVADLTARDAIAAGRRYVGMAVHVVDSGAGVAMNYQLVGGIADINWVEFAGGGGGGDYPPGFTEDFDSISVLLNPLSSHVRINGDGVNEPTIIGMVAAPDGTVITVINISGNWATFTHDAAVVPADGFSVPDGLVLESDDLATFVYDGAVTQRWIIQSTSNKSRIQAYTLRLGVGSGDVIFEALSGTDPYGDPPQLYFNSTTEKWGFKNGNGFGFTPFDAIPVTGITVSSNTTLTSIAEVILASGTITLTLMAAASFGRRLTIKNTGTGIITIDGSGTETIDGALTYVLYDQYASVTLISNGVNVWYIL